MNRPFKTYNGGKNGSGVYQAIINQIPPHSIFISGFAGNCGVLANKLPAAMANIAIDLDAAVIKAWQNIRGITAVNTDLITFLPNYLACLPVDLLSHVIVFLDPTYLGETRISDQPYYKHEMVDHATHEKFLQMAMQIPVKTLITHYPCNLYDQSLKEWRYTDISSRSRTSTTIQRLYMNYPQPEALHDYRYIGNDFRERELYKKSYKNFVRKIESMPPLERNYILSYFK